MCDTGMTTLELLANQMETNPGYYCVFTFYLSKVIK